MIKKNVSNFLDKNISQNKFIKSYLLKHTVTLADYGIAFNIFLSGLWLCLNSQKAISCTKVIQEKWWVRVNVYINSQE